MTKNKNLISTLKNSQKKRRHEDDESSSSDSGSDTEYETVDDEESSGEELWSEEEDEEDEDYSASEPSSSESEPAPPKKYSLRSNKKSAKKSDKKSDKKSKSSDKKGKKDAAAAASRRRRRIVESDSDDSSSENSDDAEESEASDEESADDYSSEDGRKEPMYSIIIAAPSGSASSLSKEYAEYFGDEADDSEYEMEMELNKKSTKHEDYTSEDERTFMKETYHKFPPADDSSKKPVSCGDESTVIESDKKSKKRRRGGAAAAASVTSGKKTDSAVSEKAATDAQQEYTELIELKKQLMEKLEKSPNNRILKNAIRDCNKSIKKLIKTTRAHNTKHYINLIQKGSSQQRTSEIDFFKTKMSNREQIRVMEELTQINNHVQIDKPYRLALLETQIPARFKAIALQKLNMLKKMEPGDNEYYKIKTWVDTFMRIPFGIYRNLNVSIADGQDVCHDFIQNAKGILDNCVYGLEDAKMQVLQMVGQWIANPNSMGTAIAIKGPPGTGKTSLIRDGISKIFGREFAFLALGGATDSSFLEGHSYTYEGSQWGRIVQILVDGKTMNPVIFFDELDKVSDTPRGEEIIGVLTHLTDTTQNSQFHDKYFSELEFDLSKCLFVFSYNDESKVNPILRDRMYVIQTKGYDVKDKLVIARKYLLPKIREQVNFAEGDVIIPDEVIQYIVSNADMTKNEEGVRNLKRCLEIIHTKLNLYRLVKPGSDLFKGNIDLENVEFPYTVTRKTVDILIKNTDKTQNQSLLAMYV